MMTVTAGTDTYGRVNVVSGTPIVTKFAMLQFLPVYPLQSFYLMGMGRSEMSGVPFLASTRSASILVIPLASLNRTSVLMAYVRAVCAVLAIVGFLALVPGIMYLSGEQLDELAMMLTRVMLIALVVGTVGGGLTYAIPQTTRRDREIRRYCGEHLRISVDPARVPSEFGALWIESIDDPLQPPAEPRARWIRQLITTRARMARATDAEGLEAIMDELLDRLRLAE